MTFTIVPPKTGIQSCARSDVPRNKLRPLNPNMNDSRTSTVVAHTSTTTGHIKRLHATYDVTTLLFDFIEDSCMTFNTT